MAVDIDKIDTRQPDPNFKPDPALRGDNLDAPAEVVEEEVVEEEVVEVVEEEEVAEVVAKTDDEEDEDEDDTEDRKKSASVPYGKFRKSRQQVKQLTTQLEQMQAKLDAVKETQSSTETKEYEKRAARIEELYEQIEEQRALGNSKDAGKLQRELDGLREDMSRAETRRMTLEAAVRSQQVSVFNHTLTQIEAVFPELVQDSDAFDEDLVEDLEETIKGYEKLGYSMVDALQRASKRILRYDPLARGKAAYLKGFSGTVPGEKKDEAKPTEKKVEVKPDPKKTDIKKNVDAAKKQPPDPADNTSDVQAKLDMNKIKPEDYINLPASARAKLRGDVLA